MAEFWSLRGLSWRQLLLRTCRRCWEDDVFGQAGRLAFYYFLGTFPAILLLLVLQDMFGGSGLRDTLLDCFRRIFPPDASALITKAVGELDAKASIGAGALARGCVRFGMDYPERHLGYDGGPEQGLPGERRSPVVADHCHRFRTHRLAGNHGPDCTWFNLLW